ncbi:AAA family ATPase [Nonomuraea sp. NN258]|uniref:KAP family P-loop NTPase fold protein n=1 Tax=Nonomuraea antri TaxID=2730852 RepID=UPI0015698740|nr:P-loop NTPase fold protein [Nonomuraea antri]NRQ33600.1 AAA family ATPase [Nonomuraea antri]
MPDIAMLSDAPVNRLGDLLRFHRYVDPLVSIISDPRTETPFTIGVYGAWGSGKSTLLGMIDERLLEEHGEEFVRVRFNPWMHRGEPEMLRPLLNALHDALAEDPRRRFADIAKRVGSITLNLAADELLKRMGLGSASMEKIGQLAREYAEMRGQSDSQIGRLRALLQREADRLAERGRKIVFFVDDLDRCGPDQIVDVLESIKLFLDLRHVFVVIALAKDVVDRGVAVRYKDFGFPEGYAVGDEYLDKMIQLPIHLYPVDPADISRFVRASGTEGLPKTHVELLEKIAAPNPRKMKRVLNVLRVTEAIMSGTPALASLRTDLVTRLVVLRVQSPDLYADAQRQPDLLRALELVHQGRLAMDHSQDFLKRFAPQPERIQALTQAYHGKYDFLEPLFRDSRFDEAAEELPVYLTMIGG